MDSTTLNTIVGIIGIVVGILGIITAFIGGTSLSTAKKMVNKIKASDNATVYAGNTTIQNGISEDTVRLISKDLTKEELCRLVIRLIPINTDDEDCIANKLARGEISADKLDDALAELPSLYYGETEPPASKEGSIWLSH